MRWCNYKLNLMGLRPRLSLPHIDGQRNGKLKLGKRRGFHNFFHYPGCLIQDLVIDFKYQLIMDGEEHMGLFCKALLLQCRWHPDHGPLQNIRGRSL